MSKYQELLKQALIVHDTAQQKVRGPLSAKRIADAVDGFAKPFEALDTIAANSKPGGNGEPDDTALMDVLRNIEAQRRVLVAIVERAEADDDATVQNVVVDRTSARALAGKQKEADQAFLAKLDEIFDLVREDLGQPNPAP
jgi:hypothetical protein